MENVLAGKNVSINCEGMPTVKVSVMYFVFNFVPKLLYIDPRRSKKATVQQK